MTALPLTSKASIGIKVRDADGEWRPIFGIAGKTIRQIFHDQEGKETVCEYKRGDKTWYFCGTEQWKKNMKKRGTAITFSEAISLLDTVNPGWLEEIPVTEEMEKTMKLLGQPKPCLALYETEGEVPCGQ